MIREVKKARKKIGLNQSSFHSTEYLDFIKSVMGEQKEWRMKKYVEEWRKGYEKLDFLKEENKKILGEAIGYLAECEMNEMVNTLLEEEKERKR